MDRLDKRRIALVGGGAALLAITALPHPTANIQILTHEVTDTAPRKIQAAVDLGILAVSVLYTWTAKRAIG
ncbi:hypothetical protein OK349_06825 [Sphingomonas sp. BT-65]|uniref:hypothetical protein n=1 Tax=Sphingomonas sp. BT-65 TaxID=2989821 RepID=UPI002235D5B0|nr:hypothetical protein [Sphingomonas sp. BT-65]MCW4461415.1 hypothetical protein [Sphingomonas sp. BT-65]